MTALISSQVDIPVIASGGAGSLEHISDVLTIGRADAALVASIVHYQTYQVSEIKTYLESQKIKVRKNW